jgi:hypothetical protein
VKTVSNQSIVATAKLLIESQGDDEQFLIAEIMMRNMLNDREIKRNLALLDEIRKL